MAAPETGPCSPWVTDEQVRECCPSLDPDFDLTDSIAYASAILFRLSGRQFPGECERTLRPCFGSNCGCGNPTWMGTDEWFWADMAYPTMPARLNGEWFNFGCCDGTCSLPSVALPAPITSVEQVVIDGEILDPTAYSVQDFRKLVRVDGNGWPCTNDLAEPSDAVNGQPGTWEVTYTYGRPIPTDAVLPAAIFTCQVAKARCGSTDCVLPQRLKQVIRQGVMLAFVDPQDFLDKGKVGIYEVDLWLGTVNPGGIQRRASVRRVDDPRKITRFT